MGKTDEGVSFLRLGEGKTTLLFLHGYGANKEIFTPHLRYFSTFYTVVAIDFLGFGKSPPLPSPFSVTDYAIWTKAVLQKISVYKPIVVAHSFGARVAIKMAKMDENAFSKMLLTGPAGVRPKRGLSYRLKVVLYRLCRRVCPTFAERNFGSKEYKTLSGAMRESYKKIVNEDLLNDAKSVRIPVRILQGDKDTVTPLKEVKKYLDAFPNATLKRIDGGHFAFLEDPLSFQLFSEEFFDE